jgi:outer membrane biosynthesis protein TonB
MNFVCPLCKEQYVFTTQLCSDCIKIKHLARIYGIQQIIDLVEAHLVVKKRSETKEEEKLEVKEDKPEVKAEYKLEEEDKLEEAKVKPEYRKIVMNDKKTNEKIRKMVHVNHII